MITPAEMSITINSIIGLTIARPIAVLPIAMPQIFDLSAEQKKKHERGYEKAFVLLDEWKYCRVKERPDTETDEKILAHPAHYCRYR